jgi:hypothetical protein
VSTRRTFGTVTEISGRPPGLFTVAKLIRIDGAVIAELPDVALADIALEGQGSTFPREVR